MQERAIILKILKGEVDEFRLLLDKYSGKVMSIVVGRVPAGDHETVIQDIFLKAFRGLSGYDFKRPFENWLMTIAVRTCCDYWRKEKRESRNIEQISLTVEHNRWLEKAGSLKSVEEFEASVFRSETMEVLEIVMQQLKPEDRVLIELVYFEGYKHKDVAEIMGWKLSKVKVRAMRAKNIMRAYIKKIMEI